MTAPAIHSEVTAPVLFPLSSYQREIYIDQQLAPDSPVYTIGTLFYIKGLLNTPLFKSVLQETVQQYDILNTELAQVGDEKVFIQSSNSAVPFQQIDLTESANPDEQLQQLIVQEEKTPIALNQGRPYKILLIQTAPDAHCLMLKFHHIIVDGKCIQPFYQALTHRYNQQLAGINVLDASEQSHAPYQQFIDADVSYRQATAYQRDRAFWTAATQTMASTWLAQPGVAVTQSRRQAFELPTATQQAMDAFCEQQQVSRFHVILSALAIYFTGAFQKPSITIGVPILNRKKPFRDSIGLFTNILPLTLDCNGQQTLGELPRHALRNLSKAYRHQRLPLGEVMRLNKGRTALPFDIKLSYEQFTIPERFGDCESTVGTLFNHEQNHPLSVFVRDYSHNRSVTLDFDFQPDCFQALTMDAVIEGVHHCLQQLLETPETRLAERSLLPPQQQRALLTPSML